MNKKTVTKNYIYNVMYQILTMVIPLITTPYLSRVLGAENIGIYSYTLSITTYFILFGSLGVAIYGQREIAYVQSDINKRTNTFYEILLMRFITLSISLIAFYCFFCLNGQYSVYYKILILELIASAFDISWYFQGLEEFKKTVIRNIIVKLISVICIFLFVKESSDLFIYFVIYVFSNFIGNISLWPYLPKYITKVNIKKLDIKRHIKPTLVLFLPQIATQIYTVLDKTMIGVFISDKSEVGFYEQAQKIVKLLIALVTSLGTVMMPRIANFYALGKSKLLKEYILKSMHFIQMLSIPLMFGIISISKKFVSVFYGNGYDKVIILLIIISPIVIALGLSNLIGIQFLLPTKQQKKFTISVIVGAITNFCLNLILIPKFKSVGACIATVFAEFFVVFSQLIMVKNDIKIMDILFASYKYFISAIIMFICSIVIGYFINNNVISIVVQILFSFIVYFSLLTLFKEKMVFEVINKIKNYIHLT